MFYVIKVGTKKCIIIKYISHETPSYNFILVAISTIKVLRQLLSQQTNYMSKLWGKLGTIKYEFLSPNESLKSLLHRQNIHLYDFKQNNFSTAKFSLQVIKYFVL